MAEKRSKQNQTISLVLLESYRRVLYEIKAFYDSVDFRKYDIDTALKVQKAILDGGEKIGKNIESLDRLEDKVKKEEKESVSRRGNAENSMFEE